MKCSISLYTKRKTYYHFNHDIAFLTLIHFIDTYQRNFLDLFIQIFAIDHCQ